jgi:hypothetical protein
MTTTLSVIAGPDGLTPSWLNQALQHAGVDASVKDVSVSPVGTGQMASCYRLDVSYRSGGGPAHLIAKLPATDPAVRAGAAMMYRTEVNFYRELAPRIRVPVPHCYVAEVTDDATAFTLLLQDLSPAAAGDQLTGCTPAQARAAAIAIAGLHGSSWCDPNLEKFDWLIPRMSTYVEFTAPRLPTLARSFLEKRDLDAATEDVLRRFAESFETWAVGRPSPFSLLHNDYRLDNLLFSPADTTETTALSVVDWQSLSTGRPLQDVAYLVGTGLHPQERRAHERDIIAAYHNKLEAHGVRDYDADLCWDDYRHALFHGPYICLMAEAVATPTERGRQMFSVMAQRSATAIRDLDCFELIEQPR